MAQVGVGVAVGVVSIKPLELVLVDLVHQLLLRELRVVDQLRVHRLFLEQHPFLAGFARTLGRHAPHQVRPHQVEQQHRSPGAVGHHHAVCQPVVQHAETGGVAHAWRRRLVVRLRVLAEQALAHPRRHPLLRVGKRVQQIVLGHRHQWRHLGQRPAAVAARSGARGVGDGASSGAGGGTGGACGAGVVGDGRRLVKEIVVQKVPERITHSSGGLAMGSGVEVFAGGRKKPLAEDVARRKTAIKIGAFSIWQRCTQIAARGA